MQIITMTPVETSAYLKEFGLSMSPTYIRCGIDQGVFKWGEHVTIKQNEYKIYKKLLDEWVELRAE